MARKEIFICDICKKEIELKLYPNLNGCNAVTGIAIIKLKKHNCCPPETLLNGELCTDCSSYLYDRCKDEINKLKDIVSNAKAKKQKEQLVIQKPKFNYYHCNHDCKH